MKKLFKISLLLLIPLVFAATFYFARAEDDDDEDDDDDDYRPKVTEETVISQPSVSTKVEKTTQTTVYKDSDGDGILDSDDPHPAIAEIYIAEDQNLNGIVDKFE